MPEASVNKIGSTCCAIVVTYFPETVSLFTLLDQLDRETDFLVIDNGSQDASNLQESVTAYSRCIEYRQLTANVGLAQALNLGLEAACSRGYRFALLFDQDSSLCAGYVTSLLAAYEQASAVPAVKLAAIGPRIVHPHSRRPTPFKLFDRLWVRRDRPFHGLAGLYQADFLITSGTLLPLSNLREIGMMKSDYFIDNIDREWCFRAKFRGYELAGTDQTVLYHAIGEYRNSRLVRSGLIASHRPQRTYYSSRNRMHLYRQPYVPWGWKLRDLPRFLLKFLWLIATSDERSQYWRYITAGIRDSWGLGRP